jgi:hypothetical protein
MVAALKILRSVGLLLVLVAGVNARAGSIAVALTPAPGNTINTGNGFSLGWEFTANANLNVTDLGIFTDGPRIESHDVGIFNVGGTLIASTSVLTSDPTTGNFAYHALPTPVTLTAGQAYWIMSTSGIVIDPDTGHADHYTFTPTSITVDPALTYLQSGFTEGTSLAFPVTTDGTPDAFFGPNFVFATDIVAVVPEPSTAFMAGTAGLFGIVAYRRRRRARVA